MISNFCSYVVKAVGPWASRDGGHNHYSGMCMGALDHKMNAKLKEGKKNSHRDLVGQGKYTAQREPGEQLSDGHNILWREGHQYQQQPRTAWLGSNITRAVRRREARRCGEMTQQQSCSWNNFERFGKVDLVEDTQEQRECLLGD